MLEKNYPHISEWVSSTKGRINNHAAHANIISADNTFRMTDDRAFANTPFFDVEDEYFVKGDLWLISSVAITLMDLFFGVAGDVARAGRSVIEFRDDFQHTIHGLAFENNALLTKIQASERYQKAMQKAEQSKPGA